MSADDHMPGRLGPYRLLDRIGEGGMGVVYLARDQEHRTVAVKVLRSGAAGEPNALQRLAREVETMRRVRSPYVAEVIGADLDGDLPYIVTRYVPGRTLDQVIAAQGPLRGPALAGLAQGLAGALAAVHAAGVVHRDLKPSNVMMVGGSPVVIDFGIAQGPDATRLTMTGMFMGTPGYLAPEVIEGQPSSEASDVHAWGATVAFAATGRPPFGTGGYETIFYKILNGQPDLEGAPPALLPLLAAALARDPAHRPPAIQLSALASVLDPGSLVPGPAAGPRLVTPPAATRAEPGSAMSPAGSGIPAAGPGLAAAGTGLAAAGPGIAGAGVAAVAGGAAAARQAVAAGGAGMPAVRSPGGAAGMPGGLADYADVLPPVAYQPPGGPAGAPPAGARLGAGLPGDRPAAAASSRGHALLAYASVVVLISASVLLPVAGTVAALILILLLRAGDGARRGAAIRRSTRGARPSDPLVAAVSFPWHLLRSAFGLLALSPIAAAAAALVAGVTMIAVQADRLPHAVAYGAGALVAFYGLGPGSLRPRHQLAHLYARLTPTRIGQAAALIAVMALAAGAVTAAASWPPLYSPIQPPASFSHLGYVPGSPLRLLNGGKLLSYLRGR